MGVSGLQLCELVGIAYSRFAMRRLRAHERAGSAVASRVDHAAADHMPVKSLARHVGYNAEDALMLASPPKVSAPVYPSATPRSSPFAADARAVLTHDTSNGDLFVGC